MRRTWDGSNMLRKVVPRPHPKVSAYSTGHAISELIICQATACANDILEPPKVAHAFDIRMCGATHARGGCLLSILICKHIRLTAAEPKERHGFVC
jgi:hypothetical protein